MTLLSRIARFALSAGYRFLAFTLVLEVLMLGIYTAMGHEGFITALSLAIMWTLTQIIVVKAVSLKVAPAKS